MPASVIKVVFLGDSAVGKTSILLHYVKGRFDDKVDATIASQFYVHEVDVANTRVQLQFWDTAGQERFASLARMYYRDAKVACIVYDVTDRKTFERCHYWLNELRHAPTQPLVVAILANKVDVGSVNVPRELGLSTAEKENALFFETSAKTGEGVDDCFRSIVETCLERQQPAEPLPTSVRLDDSHVTPPPCSC